MKKLMCSKFFCIVMACLLSYTATSAQTIISREYFEPFTDFDDIEIEVEDDRLSELISNTGVDFRDKETYGLISVGFDPDMNICYSEALKYKISVKAVSLIIPTPGDTTTQTDYFDLIINYDPLLGTLETESAFIKLDSARKIFLTVVEVKSIDNTGAETTVPTPDLLPADVYIEAEIYRERYDDFNPTLSGSVPTLTSIFWTSIFYYQIEHQVHVIEWQNVDGAVEYEIEWTYANNYGPSSLGTSLTDDQIQITFKNNATSVRVKRNAVNRYFIPAIYGSGVVVYRIRAIGRGGPNLDDDIFGEWTLPDPSYTLEEIIDDHIDAHRASFYISASDNPSLFNNLNSQYSVQFAEDGKLMASGTFADGSMRVRQNVAAVKIHPDSAYGKMAVITETIYDHLGRAAITTLPAVTENGLWYTPNYSLNENGDKYSYLDFDTDVFADSSCVTGAGPMWNTSGASKYYSGNNAYKHIGHQGLIADAYQYPFIQNIFERDNTSRPKLQSGVGDQHRIGSGHETKYIYGGAEQTQLNRLFGTDAGYAGYYQKNMIQDANGQISITYTDMAGRTIATSLAGEVPDNVQSLRDSSGNALAETGDTVSDDMLVISSAFPNGASNMISPDSMAFTFSTSILIDSEQEYTFSYSAEVADFMDSCFVDICFDCIYDLELSLMDECGNYVIGNAGLDGPLKMTIGGLSTDTLCNDTNFVALDDMVLLLKPGVYTIFKRLSINEDSMNVFVDKMLESSSCLLPPGYFYQAPDLSGCEITCEQCQSSIGTWEEFFTQEKIDSSFGGDSTLAHQVLLQVFTAMQAECNDLCSDNSRDYCDAAYHLMLMDMSPGGQYALTDTALTSIYLSIFSPTNLLPVKLSSHFSTSIPAGVSGATPTWRKPVLFKPNTPTPFTFGYYDELGQRAKVYVQRDANDEFLPRVLDTSMVYLVDITTNQYYTYHENLLYTDDFISRWQSSFAKSLVFYHPEFFQYEYCSGLYQYTETIMGQTVDPYNFDEVLRNMSFSQADSAFGLSSSSTIIDLFDAITAVDPYFAQHPMSGCSGSSFTYAPLADLTPCNLFKTKFLNFQNLDVMRNIAQSAYIQNTCGYTYPLGCGSLPTQVWESGGLIHNNQTWLTFAEYYSSAKQQTALGAMSLYAFFGDTPDVPGTWNIIDNECIGNNGYIPTYSWQSGTVTLENPCAAPQFVFYWQKERRFKSTSSQFSDEFGLSDPPTLDELQQYALQGAYQQTGKCPMASDLEFLLGKLSMDDKLSAGLVNLNTGGYMGNALYSFISDTLANDTLTVYYQSSSSGNTLHGGVGIGCNAFSLTLPPAAVTAGYSFNDIEMIFGIRDIVPSGADHLFKVSAIFLNPTISSVPETLEVSGISCLPLTGCELDFKNLCRPTKEAEDLMNLLNALSFNGDLFSGSVSLTPAYDLFISPRLQVYLQAGPYQWDYNSMANEFELSSPTVSIILDVSTSGLNPSSTYQFTSVSGTLGTSSTVTSFPNFVFTGVEIDTANYFPFPTLDTAAVYASFEGVVNVVGISQSFPVTECEEIIPINCNTQEHRNLRELKDYITWSISGASFNTSFNDSCWVITYVSDSLFSVDSTTTLLSLDADMSLSQNNVNSNYFTFIFKNDDGSIAIYRGSSCKPLRNCISCEEPAGCGPGDGTLTIGPLSQFSPQTYTHMSIAPPSSCLDFEPQTMYYTHASPAQFWQDWALSISSAMSGTHSASVEGDYLVINLNAAAAECKCNASNLYELKDSENNTLGSYEYRCCGEQQEVCPSTILDIHTFEEGWFGEQTIFEQVLWGATTDSSLVYEEDSLLIFENKCHAIIRTELMDWDTSALYKISYEVVLFNTPDTVDDVTVSFFDSAGAWAEGFSINQTGPQVHYYTPLQSNLRLGIEVQNIYWVGDTGYCTGSSKVGLKYLKIENLGPNYALQEQYVSGYGFSAVEMGQPGESASSLGLYDMYNPAMGVISSIWLADSTLQISSPCAGGFLYSMDVCPEFEYEIQTQISGGGSYAPTAVYALVMDLSGNFIDVSGPHAPGIITLNFTPGVNAVNILHIGINSDSVLTDLLSMLGAGKNFNDFCTDSLHMVMTSSIVTNGCKMEYGCGEPEPEPCAQNVYSVNTFSENWFESQTGWESNAWNGTDDSEIYENGGMLILDNQCMNVISKTLTGTEPNQLYHIQINTAAVDTFAYPYVGLLINPLPGYTNIARYPLRQGLNDIYLPAPATDWRMIIEAGNIAQSEDTFYCLSSSKVAISSILIEKFSGYHVQENFYTDYGVDSTLLSTPSLTVQNLGINQVVAPTAGLSPTALSIVDGKILVESDCTAAFWSSTLLCANQAYDAQMGIVASDTATAPSHIAILTMGYDGSYLEAHGPYNPGIINYQFTPTGTQVDFYVIALKSATLPPLGDILGGTDSFENYCTGPVSFYVTHSQISNACVPSYACGPYTDSIDWEPVVPLSFGNECQPTILPFPVDTAGQGNPCVEYLLETAQANADYQYQQYLDQMREEYRQLYKRKCMVPVRENLDRVYTDGQYHYTLYYYDRAGNLVKTVPPHAVVPLSGADLAAVNDARDNNTVKVPAHNVVTEDAFALSTRYRYNSLNQPVEQETPDGGKSTFYYDRLGRVSVSQNAVQNENGQYSYTLYDMLGRINEVGRFTPASAASRTLVYEPATQSSFFAAASGHAEVTRTFYDSSATFAFLGPFSQHNLRSRVSYTLAMPLDETDFVFGTYYDYDIHGNVKALVHRNDYAPAPELRQNLVEYEYDLVSGVVKKVSYNSHRPDRYFHRYAYDDQNRLTHAHTSRNDIKYDLDARYFYYWHGPLARVELGQNKVQGLDYAYTLHGWLKSLNSDALAALTDPGLDGDDDPGNPNRYFGRDAYGMSLHYYTDDYTPIESSYGQSPAIPAGYNTLSLYNGNISAMNNTLKKPGDYAVLPLLQRFGYDQLNRIADSRAFNDYDPGTNQWNASASPLDIYATSYSYDPAGNLLTLNRMGNKTDTLEMDSLKYVYYGNTNRLMRVEDAVAAANYGIDIDDQSAYTNNYAYDAIGNLIKDEAEEIDTIKWTVYGKVSEVIRTSGSQKPDLKFYYDAAGRRIMKRVIPKTGAAEKTEFYAHDAQGNTLTIYSYIASDTATYTVSEQMIYGSSRLGTWKSCVELLSYIPAEPEILVTDRGSKQYEMNDHLGNVHAVVSDRKKRICDEGEFAYYEADIRSTYDYYAFGMMMPGRNFDSPPQCDTTVTEFTDTLYYNVNGDTTGWVPYGGCTVSTDAGRLLLATSTPPNAWGASLQLALEAGRTYSISVDYTLSEIPACARNPEATISFAEAADEAYAEDFDIGTGNLSGSFIPLYTGLYTLSFSVPDSTCKDSLWIDNILVTTIDTLFSPNCVGKDNYRFGFNGKEKVDEAYGDNNAYDFGARLYDPRLGRWMSVDPMARERSWVSPYNFVQNNPLMRIDPTGMLDDNITLNSKGEVAKIERNNEPNRFFDENGSELFLNDGKKLDGPMTIRTFNVGDKVYEPMSRSETQKALDDAGSIQYVEGNFWLDPAKAIFEFKYYWASKYGSYDFGFDYLQPKLCIPINTMIELYEGGGWDPDVPFIRFEGTNKLYNLPDAGNFMWGKKAKDNGLPKDYMLDAANKNEGGADTDADQKAIIDGYNY